MYSFTQTLLIIIKQTLYELQSVNIDDNNLLLKYKKQYLDKQTIIVIRIVHANKDLHTRIHG